MRRILLRHPDIAVKLLAALAERLREANERIARQSFQTVAEPRGRRAARAGRRRAADGAGESRRAVIQATQAEIAQLAGASRESVSRFLATPRARGSRQLRSREGRLHDPDALRNYIY